MLLKSGKMVQLYAFFCQDQGINLQKKSDKGHIQERVEL